MQEDKSIMFWGEDVTDPYGGAFKVSKGLSTKFNNRVISTPISEAALVGIATGRAMKKMPTIVEIMFGDFITLCADQIINHATKFSWVYNNQVSVPLVIRAPMGGYRGYGATHSQSIEKIFCGIPGLTVLAINSYSNPGALLEEAVSLSSPVLFIEHKLLYGKFLSSLPTPPSKPDITLVCYGYMVNLAIEAAIILEEEEEIFCQIVPLEKIWPIESTSLIDAVSNTESIMIIEEGSEGYGFGSECARILANSKKILSFIAAESSPIPNSKKHEENVLPSVNKIVIETVKLFNNSQTKK